jgi:hypothetical protein
MPVVILKTTVNLNQSILRQTSLPNSREGGKGIEKNLPKTAIYICRLPRLNVLNVLILLSLAFTVTIRTDRPTKFFKSNSKKAGFCSAPAVTDPVFGTEVSRIVVWSTQCLRRSCPCRQTSQVKQRKDVSANN